MQHPSQRALGLALSALLILCLTLTACTDTLMVPSEEDHEEDPIETTAPLTLSKADASKGAKKLKIKRLKEGETAPYACFTSRRLPNGRYKWQNIALSFPASAVERAGGVAQRFGFEFRDAEEMIWRYAVCFIPASEEARQIVREELFTGAGMKVKKANKAKSKKSVMDLSQKQYLRAEEMVTGVSKASAMSSDEHPTYHYLEFDDGFAQVCWHMGDDPYGDLWCRMAEIVESDEYVYELGEIVVYESGEGWPSGSGGSSGGHDPSDPDGGNGLPEPAPRLGVDCEYFVNATTCQAIVLGPTLQKKDILSWHKQMCPDLIQSNDDLTNQKIESNYEGVIADFLFGGLGRGRVSRFVSSINKGLDGYQTWYWDSDGNRLYDYVQLVVEAKLTSGPPFSNESKHEQAIRHLDFLASERDRFIQDHPSVVYYGRPVYVVVSQNERFAAPNTIDERGDPGWWIGTRGSYGDWHQQILDHADSLGITVLHMKVANSNILGNNVVFQLLNDYPLLQSPLNDWLNTVLEAGTEVGEVGKTYETLIPFDFKCGAWKDSQRPPPGGIIP